MAAASGRLVNTIGDGYFVLFESVLDAVECAIAVQKKVAEIEQPHFLLRIGLHTGDATLMEGDAYGDTINTTSRIMAKACPGGICLSEDIAGQVRTQIAWACNPIGEFHLKHITQPLRLCLLVSPDQAVVTRNPPYKKRKRLLGISVSVVGSLALLGVIWMMAIAPLQTKFKANRLVGQGKTALENRTPEMIQWAQEKFNQALAIDPDNVAGLSMLALSKIIDADISHQSNKVAFADAALLVNRALSTNTQCADALAVQGYLFAVQGGHWERSEQSFLQGMASDPDNTTAPHWYATTLMAQNRFLEADKVLKSAHKEHPYRTMSVIAIGFPSYYQKDYRGAISIFGDACKKEAIPCAHIWLGRALTHDKQYKEALEEFEKGKDFAEEQISRAYCLARMGNETGAKEILRGEEKKCESTYIGASHISKVYCGLSLAAQEKSEQDNYLDQAVEWLKKAHEYEDGDLLMLAVDPAYEPLHDRKEYQYLLKARNLKLSHEH